MSLVCDSLFGKWDVLYTLISAYFHRFAGDLNSVFSGDLARTLAAALAIFLGKWATCGLWPAGT